MENVKTRKKRSILQKLFIPIMGTFLIQMLVFIIIIMMIHIPEADNNTVLFKDVFFSFTNKMHFIMMLAIVVLLILEALCIYAIGVIAINPITAVLEELKKIDPLEKIQLQETHIKKIDRLTDSIENMSSAIENSASKISKIIDLAQIPIGVFEYEEKGNKVFCSSKLVQILGWDESEYVDSYYNRDTFFKNLTNIEKYWYQNSGNTSIYKIPQEIGNKWIQITLLREKHEILGTVTDISKSMEEKIRIEFERDYDVLTGIFNRRAFEAALDNLFVFPVRIGIGAFVMFDLDNLKYVNDTYGHEAGDNYIKAMAKALKEFEDYNGIVSRRSGDEFNVFLHGYHSKEQLRDIIFAVYKKIEEQSIMLPGQKEYSLMASAGVAYYPDDAADIKLLTTYADFAMYMVKHSIKGNIQEFNSQDYKDRSYLINGHEALVRLLDRGELCYSLQPIYDAVNGTVYGYEMLMRSKLMELSSPLEILSMAKSQSKLYQLERTTWFNAMKTFSDKVKSGEIEKGCKVFFNSFGSLILQDDDIYDFTSKYKNYLSSIVLELIETEQHIIKFSEARTKMIKDFGGMIALDNFGSGYNNDALLVVFSPNLIKIDKSIISKIDEDKGKQEVLKHITTYAHSRNIGIVAEGVETQSEMETVISFGVEFLQGYYIGKPATDVMAISEKVKQEIKAVRVKYFQPPIIA